MEHLLSLYGENYDELYSVVCFDERPCFLIGDTVLSITIREERVSKENYTYSKHGSCCVLAGIEPLTGKRIVHVRKRRRKEEFAFFMFELCRNYPKAEKIRVVLDNLNTHVYGAFYDFFDAQTAEEMSQKIEFVYTPKSASWLNMIEIEFSALSRQCLNRRIPCMERLKTEVEVFFEKRTKDKVKINWQFSINAARQKLNSRYAKVNKQNLKCNKT